MPYIYKITNNVNHKNYIGKTSRAIKDRWIDHCNERMRSTERPLYRAMNKYGVDNFTIQELEYVETDELACQREKFWIAYYNSYNCGYNATLGGDGKVQIDYDLVVKTYRELRNQMKTAKMLNISVDAVNYILKGREETILNISEVMTHSYGKSVNMYNLSNKYLRTFVSINEAARYMINNNLTNCKHTTIKQHISEVCRGKRQTAAKFKWQFVNN